MPYRHTFARPALIAVLALSLGPLRAAKEPFDPAMDFDSLCSTAAPRASDADGHAREAIQGTAHP